MNVSARNRTKVNMPWALTEFLWRRKHHGDLWKGLLKCLSEVSYSNVSTNPAYYTEDYPSPEDDNEEGEDLEDNVEVEDSDGEDEESDDESDDDYVL